METAKPNTIESKPRLLTVRRVIYAVLALAALVVVTFYVPVMTRTRAHPIELVEMKGMEMAIKSYQTEYNKLPPLGVTDESLPVESRGDLIRILTGKDFFKNPREITFYAPSSFAAKRMREGSTGTDIRDRTGKLYRLHFDWNGNGEIANPKIPGSNINASVIVYSAGPDGDYDTWADNYISWE